MYANLKKKKNKPSNSNVESNPKCSEIQGEEIGMTDAAIPDEHIKDFLFRDRFRTPMQWDNTINAGFSTAEKTWLPICSNYNRYNVEIQKSEHPSHFNVFQKLIQLRKDRLLKYGGLTIKAITENVFAYKRQINGEPDVIVVILNMGSSRRTVDLKVAFDGIPDQMDIYVSSVHSEMG